MQKTLPIFSSESHQISTTPINTIELVCQVCPHFCSLANGETGRCLVRKNLAGEIRNSVYGHVSVLSVEPIEKRPFFHFDVGQKYLAVGFFGCSLSCQYCANFTVSQTSDGKHKIFEPQDLCQLVMERDVAGFAFTFNEPTVHYEYLLEVGKINNHRKHIVLKTNGFVTKSTLEGLVPIIDAFNVDIKGDDKEYQTVCGGWLQPVIDAAEYIRNQHKHLEISYLVAPRLVNDFSFHGRMRDWLCELSVPVHILNFYPFYRMPNASYDLSALLAVYSFFAEKLDNVYLSNVFDLAVVVHRNTYCPDCGSLMIDRQKGVKIYKKICCGKGIF